ncbi:hypothetical protein HanIR_Chr02g0061971 [Helianthus annuus]|nr:hypothetical protein HanIR_Chr02g0061971 [Helianthus annuus]
MKSSTRGDLVKNLRRMKRYVREERDLWQQQNRMKKKAQMKIGKMLEFFFLFECL